MLWCPSGGSPGPPTRRQSRSRPGRPRDIASRRSCRRFRNGGSIAATRTPTPVAGSTTITFDDLPSPNRQLNGQYPTGVIDWGTGTWYHSGPYGLFTTRSVSFNGSSFTNGPLGFVASRRLTSLQAFNGGTAASTISVSCAGQGTVQRSVPAGQMVTVQTNWTGTCTTVTIGSTNGGDTNFDNLTIDTGP